MPVETRAQTQTQTQTQARTRPRWAAYRTGPPPTPPPGPTSSSDAGLDAGADDADAGHDSGANADGAAPWVDPIDPYWLDFAVVDAAYSRQLDLLVLLADDARLVLLGSNAEPPRPVALAAAGRALSLSQDGREALVAHAASVSRIDLVSGAVNTYDAAVDVGAAAEPLFSGIVHAGARAYLAAANSTKIFGLDLASGEVSEGAALSTQGNVLRPHPDGRLVYATPAPNQSETATVLDVSSGRAAVVTLVAGCGSVFLTDDGDRLVNGCGTVLSISSEPGRAHAYAGRLEHLPQQTQPRVSWLDHFADTGRVAYIAREDISAHTAREVVIAEDRYLTPRGMLDLPRVTGGVACEGRFVFFHASGSSLWVVVRTFAERRWGVLLAALPVDARVVEAPDEIPLSSGNGIDALGLAVVDAEYSDPLQKLVLVSEQPSDLLLLDPDTLDREPVALPLRPIALALSPDQKTAAIAHLGWVSIVDLTLPELKTVLPVPAPLDGVALAGDGHAWAFEGLSQTPGAYSVDTASGEVRHWPATSSGGIPSLLDSDGVMHPDGARIYGTGLPVDNPPLGGINLSNLLARYDIAQGEVTASYATTNSICLGLRLNDGGSRLLTACGRIFRSDPDPSLDMRYRGSLKPPLPDWGTGGYAPLDHSASAGLIASGLARGLSGPHDGLAFFEDRYLTPYATRVLPPSVYDRTEVQSSAQFVFFSADGSRLHVITRSTNAVLRDAGLYTLPIPSTVALPAP